VTGIVVNIVGLVVIEMVVIINYATVKNFFFYSYIMIIPVFSTKQRRPTHCAITEWQVLVMGASCPGCVDITPQLATPREYSLPAFESVRVKRDEVSVILYSSGTTGPSKGVMLSDRFFQHHLLITTYESSTLVVYCWVNIVVVSDRMPVLRYRPMIMRYESIVFICCMIH